MGLGSVISQLGGAVGTLFETQGNVAEANSYTSAAQLEQQNAQLTAASTRIQGYQEARTVTQSLGTTQADVAGAGFTDSGSALDILKSSAQQGSLATSLINIQGAINENAYAAEAGADLAKAKAANEATTAGTISAIASIGGALLSGGETLASAANGTGPLASLYNYVTGGSSSGPALFGPDAVSVPGETTGTSIADAEQELQLGGNTGLESSSEIAASGEEGAGDEFSVLQSGTDSSILSGSLITSAEDLGGAAIGTFAGTKLAGALGETGSSGAEEVGGAVGGAIGTAVAGPLGSVVGSVLGTLVGGLFGNGQPSDETEVGGISLINGKVNTVYETQESDTGSKYSASNAAVADNAQVGASNFASFLLANGATPTANTTKYNPNLVIKVGSRDGLQVGTQNEAGGSNALDYTQNLPTSATSDQLISAINQVVLSQYNIPAALQTQLQSMNLGAFYSSSYTA